MSTMRPSIELETCVERVPQEHHVGCGVSCVAAILGCSYADARKRIGAGARLERTYPRDLTKALEGNFTCDDRLKPLGAGSFKRREELIMGFDFIAIIKTHVSRDGSRWHWVVWNPETGKLIDSRTPEYKTLRAVSYLKVEKLTVKKRRLSQIGNAVQKKNQ